MTRCSCGRRARRSRSGSRRQRLVAPRHRHRHDLLRRPATSASACAARPAAWTTSARASRALSPPGAPTGLLGISGDGNGSLAWNAPSFDGGSPITGYRIYRGHEPGRGELPAERGRLAHELRRHGPDRTAQTYYYKVSAENAIGEGPLSNEASATPTDLVPPARAAAHPRRLQPPEREPALRRRALGERRRELG